MSYQINIGLPSFYEGIEIDEILAGIEYAGLTCHRFEIHGPRLVAEVTVNGCFSNPDRVMTRLAKSLDREAIAAYHVQLRTGQLYGPKAEAYGPFNLAKFKQLSEDVTA